MKKIIIVGASSVGLELTRRVSNSILIEADPAKFTMLERENPERDIFGGDASLPATLIRAGIEDAEALVLVTNKDYVNLKVALAARDFSVPKVVSRIFDEEYRQEFLDAGITHLISPTTESIDAILERVFPEREIITDIVITKESPAFGKSIRDIRLPSNCVIGAILKAGKLHKPNPGVILEEGDTLSLVSLGDVDVEVFETLAGSYRPYLPHDKIIFLLCSSEDIGALAETAFLAKKLDVKCEVVMELKDEKLKVKARELLEKAGCEFEFNPTNGNLLQNFKNHVSGLRPESGIFVALHQTKKGWFSHSLPLSFISELLNSSTVPVLFARGNRYKRILHILDSTRVGERCTRCAVGLAIKTSSKLFALYPHTSGTAEHEIVRGHTKRMARIYNIDVVEDIIEGDPTIEFVQKVRSEDKQLVLVHWDSPRIRRDILNRIINDAEASVLVVER